MKSVFLNRKKRSREEIIASILLSAKNGATKTGIMYANYLSFSQLNKYLGFALATETLYVEQKTGKYVTTSKGIEYLKRFQDVNSIENHAIEKRKLLSDLLTDKNLPVR